MCAGRRVPAVITTTPARGGTVVAKRSAARRSRTRPARRPRRPTASRTGRPRCRPVCSRRTGPPQTRWGVVASGPQSSTSSRPAARTHACTPDVLPTPQGPSTRMGRDPGRSMDALSRARTASHRPAFPTTGKSSCSRLSCTAALDGHEARGSWRTIARTAPSVARSCAPKVAARRRPRVVVATVRAEGGREGRRQASASNPSSVDAPPSDW